MSNADVTVGRVQEELDAAPAGRLKALSLEQKVRLLTGADFWSLWPEPAIGLRRLVVSDVPAGARGERWDERDPSANVPSPTALSATWDEARVERMGRLLAAECRRKGVDVLPAPTVILHRSPYGGRHVDGVRPGGLRGPHRAPVVCAAAGQRVTPRSGSRLEPSSTGRSPTTPGAQSPAPSG
jgi:Glycosyl hydrolase family 3 N terminal domain